jgi:hypothetical protein
MDNKEILEKTLQKCNTPAPSEIAALVVNDYLGGEIAKTILKVDGEIVSYYFNIIEDKRIDFNKRLPKYVGVSHIVTRNGILKDLATAKRYHEVKKEVDSLMPLSGF